MENPLNSFKRVKLVYGLIIGFFAGLTLFGETLESVTEAKRATGILFVFKIFGPEIVLLLFLVFFWKDIKSLIQNVYNYVRFGELRNKNRLLFFFIPVFLSLLLVFTSYHGFYYVIGKKIRFKNYDKEFIITAGEYFNKGDVKLAKLHLNACADLLNSQDCAYALKKLEKREQEMAFLRNFYKIVPNNVNYKQTALKNMNEAGVDKEYIDRLCSEFASLLDDLKIQYTKAIGKIKNGDFERAQKSLDSINQFFPGYGDSNVIVTELKSLEVDSIPTINATPYVWNILDDDESRYIEVLTAPYEIDCAELKDTSQYIYEEYYY